MSGFLGKLCNVRPAEWPRVQVLFAMVAILLVGSSWGEPIVEAAFLRQVGVHYLPLAIMGNAACSILAMSAYAAFADQVANDRLMIIILGIGIAGIMAGLALLMGGLVVVAIPLLYLVANVPLTDVFNVHWATYVNGFYDTRAARRIIPVLGAGARLAGVIAGLTLPLMNRLLPPPGIIVIWLSCVGGMALLAWQMPRLLGEPRLSPSPSRTEGARRDYLPHLWVGAHLREGYGYVRRTPFLRVMAVTTLLTMVLLAFVNYQTGKLLLAHLGTVQNISSFTGLLSGLGNLIALPFQLIFMSRLINRTGLGNASLIFPVTTLVACGGLVAAPGLGTAAVGQLDRTILRTSLRNPIDSLLYNAVPLRVKGRARAFISGLLVPAGSLAGGGLLLLLQAGPSWAFQVALMLTGLLAAAFMVAAWAVRSEYRRALIALLEQEDYSSLLAQEGQPLAAVEPATLQLLRDRLAQAGTRPDMAIFMADLISQVGGAAAGPILVQACRAAGDGRVRSAILDILAAAGLRGEAVRRLCLDSLTDGDWRTRQSAITGLESATGAGDQGAQAALLALAGDPHLDVCTQALLALATRGDFQQLPQATAALQGLLTGADARVRSRGVRVLGQLRGAGTSERLLPYLADPADDVRLEAALALEKQAGELSGPERARLPELAGRLLHDPVERVRLVALALLQDNESPAACDCLVAALADASPQVRADAARALVAIGADIVPRLQSLLAPADRRSRHMATTVLCRITWRGFGGSQQSFAGRYGEPAIRAGLEQIDCDRARLAALAPRPGSRGLAVLRSALAERDRQWLDEVFDLLAAIYGDEPVRLILNSLRSPTARVRANAVEALEALASPGLALMVAPLFEPDATTSVPVPAALPGALPAAADGFEAALRELAEDPFDPFVQAIAVYVQGELAGTQDEALTATRPAAPATAIRGGTLLSTIERILFLKEVPFFQGMTIEQLRVLATVCEEEFFAAEQRIFKEGDPGGALYCVVSGRVALEQEKRKGAFARLATLEAHCYFGEMNLFDDSPRSVAALAIQDTLALRLRREPLIALARQYPDLSLELINVLSARLRELSDRMADLTRTRPRELHRLYDRLDTPAEG